MVARGQFRRDLYYRLNVFPHPCCRRSESAGDIPALVTHFVKRFFSRRMGSKSSRVLRRPCSFQWYSWPGNIRELQNLVERAVILSRTVCYPPTYKEQTELMSQSASHRTLRHR